MKFFFISLILFSLPFKSCRKEAPVAVVAEPTGVEKDSATIQKELREQEELKETNKIVSDGTICGYEFQGKARKITDTDLKMDIGMDLLLTQGKYAELKLHDDVHGITVSIRVLDLELFDKVPFSYTFTEGKKLIVTVYIKNKEGVNEIYGGTIQNIRGRFTVNGISKDQQTLIGVLEADLSNVLDLDQKCHIESLKFYNARYYFSNQTKNNDPNKFKYKETTIVQ